MRPHEREALARKLPALWADVDVTVRAIAERFGLSTSTVQNHAHAMGLGDKPKVRVARQRVLPSRRPGWQR